MSNTYNFKTQRQGRAVKLRERKRVQRFKSAAKRELSKERGY